MLWDVTHGSPVHRFGDSGLLVREAGGRTCQSAAAPPRAGAAC